jgi:hypothetical protein
MKPRQVKLRVVWEGDPGPDAAARLAAAFDLLWKKLAEQVAVDKVELTATEPGNTMVHVGSKPDPPQ